jgi:cytochrome c553
LQLQLEELEDELRKAGKGAGVADQLLQQQLNAVEAAYADLQDELVRHLKGQYNQLQ